MERHAQNINRGELVRRRGSRLWHWSAGGEQVHCASLGFFLPPQPHSRWDGEENRERRRNSWVEIRRILSLKSNIIRTIIIMKCNNNNNNNRNEKEYNKKKGRRGRGVRERLCGAWLLTGVKPQQLGKGLHTLIKLSWASESPEIHKRYCFCSQPKSLSISCGWRRKE